MFDRIEKRFTKYSLLVLSLVVLVSFLGIYLFMRGSIYRDIDREMMSLERTLSPPKVQKDLPPEEDRGLKGHGAVPPMGFIARTEGDTVQIFSPFEKDSTHIPYQQLVETATARTKDKGTVSGVSGKWRYQQGEGDTLYFVEISRQTKILNTIVLVALGIYLVLFFVFWYISRRFAKQSMRPARKAYEQQTEFIANVSHELKTPLAVIKTNAEALAMTPEQTIGQQIRWLQNIQGEVERMNGLLSDMIGMSLSTTEELSVETFELSALVEEVLLGFEPPLYEKQIQLIFDSSPVLLETDAGQLRRVIYILLENAVSYTPPHGKLWITTGVAPGIPLRICNTGDGILPQEQEKVFERFFRGDSARQREGSNYGLGLPIARQRMENLGGSLTLSLTDTICFSVGLKSSTKRKG